MKSIILSAFIIVISFGICGAQSTTNTISPEAKIKQRTETVTQHLTAELNLSPSQQEQVKTVYQESLTQIQNVIETNNGNKSVAADQVHTLIQQRNTALQSILTPAQLSIYTASNSK